MKQVVFACLCSTEWEDGHKIHAPIAWFAEREVADDWAEQQGARYDAGKSHWKPVHIDQVVMEVVE